MYLSVIDWATMSVSVTTCRVTVKNGILLRIWRESVVASIKILASIIIFIYCNWVVTRWQWLCYMYKKHEISYY